MFNLLHRLFFGKCKYHLWEKKHVYHQSNVKSVFLFKCCKCGEKECRTLYKS